MDSQERIMRCQIEGNWTAKEMADSLLAFRGLYNLRLGLQIISDDWRYFEKRLFIDYDFPTSRRTLRTLSSRRIHPLLMQLLFSSYGNQSFPSHELEQIIYPHEELKVRRINYASPGFKDLAGLGEIVGHIKDFTLRIIEHRSSSKNRDLKDEEQEIRNQSLRIQNAIKLVALAKECGYDDIDFRELVMAVDNKQDLLVKLADARKLRNVKMLDEDEDEDSTLS